jgi:hypothetical protein
VGEEDGGYSDAIEAAALATALAESALDLEREEQTAGARDHTPASLCDFDDPDFGVGDWPCSGMCGVQSPPVYCALPPM